jgi:hypothetical protein
MQPHPSIPLPDLDTGSDLHLMPHLGRCSMAQLLGWNSMTDLQGWHADQSYLRSVMAKKG